MRFVRAWPVVLLLAGAALLAVAEFATLYDVRVITAVPKGGHHSVGAHHSYALLIVAIALVPMALGAVLVGSRAAAAACLVLAAVAVFVVLAIDLPDLDQTGLVGESYEGAQTVTRSGFYLESLGAALAVVGAVAALVFSGPARERRSSSA